MQTNKISTIELRYLGEGHPDYSPLNREGLPLIAEVPHIYNLSVNELKLIVEAKFPELQWEWIADNTVYGGYFVTFTPPYEGDCILLF